MSNKLKRKAKPYKAPLNVSNFTAQQMANITGSKVDSLKFWCANREKEYEKFYSEQAREKLFKAEDYIAVANVLISLLAIKMTWGFTKANQKFLENLNPAKDYLERNGVEKVYQELHKQMGIELLFDNMDINKEFGFGGDVRNVDGENIVGMKLIDAVKGMPDDIEMCIGAGRAFMFCGNRNEFYKDIDHVNHHQVKIVERKMKKAYNGILKKFKELKTSKVSIESMRKKTELLEELFEEYYKCVKYLMGYGRIEERKIESVKNRIRKNSIAIIIEGTENGGFWDKEEYDRWRSKL